MIFLYGSICFIVGLVLGLGLAWDCYKKDIKSGVICVDHIVYSVNEIKGDTE
jgi:hypothetical protein